MSFQAETFSFGVFTFWRVMGLMLAGMAFLKLGFFDRSRPASFYRKMIIAGVSIGIPITLYGTYREFLANWDPRVSGLIGMQLAYWASLLISGGWIGAIALASQSEWMRTLTRRLAAVGRMAFTNYLVQSLICTFLFYGHGFGQFERVDRAGQLAIVVAIWIFQLVISPIWMKHFLFGPMEWLWRSLTYLKWEPFRRTVPAGI